MRPSGLQLSLLIVSLAFIMLAPSLAGADDTGRYSCFIDEEDGVTTELQDEEGEPLSFEAEEERALARKNKLTKKIKELIKAKKLEKKRKKKAKRTLLKGDLRLVRNCRAGTIKDRPARVEAKINLFMDEVGNQRCTVVPFVTFHDLDGVLWDKVTVEDNGTPLTLGAIPPFDDVFVLGVSTFLADPGRHQLDLAPKLTGRPETCEEAAEEYLQRYTNARVLVNFQPDP